MSQLTYTDKYMYMYILTQTAHTPVYMYIHKKDSRHKDKATQHNTIQTIGQLFFSKKNELHSGRTQTHGITHTRCAALPLSYQGSFKNMYMYMYVYIPAASYPGKAQSQPRGEQERTPSAPPLGNSCWGFGRGQVSQQESREIHCVARSIWEKKQKTM